MGWVVVGAVVMEGVLWWWWWWWWGEEELGGEEWRLDVVGEWSVGGVGECGSGCIGGVGECSGEWACRGDSKRELAALSVLVFGVMAVDLRE